MHRRKMPSSCQPWPSLSLIRKPHAPFFLLLSECPIKIYFQHITWRWNQSFIIPAAWYNMSHLFWKLRREEHGSVNNLLHRAHRAIALFLADHQAHSRLTTSLCLSLGIFRISYTTSRAELRMIRWSRTPSKSCPCQHFRTCLHFRKQYPPSSSRHPHTGHLVSIPIRLLAIFSRRGKLLCARRHRNCFTLGTYSTFHNFPQKFLSSVPVAELEEPDCFTF